MADDHMADGTLLVIFNNDRQMGNLCLRFERMRRTTDVLAFNLADSLPNRYIEGEIYVNLQTARRQADDFDVDYYEEVVRLCVHGLLHLLGYGDKKPALRKKMWRIQEGYLKGIIDG